MPKVNRFYCLKCGNLVELIYLPGMHVKTEELFERLTHGKLCQVCIDNKPAEKKYLN
jgi:hypothetical protein